MPQYRCIRATDDALMRGYHDKEWGVPQRDGRMLCIAHWPAYVREWMAREKGPT
jgi:hypothetical protein